MPHFVTFGQIMLRMAPAGHLRITQTLPGSIDVTFKQKVSSTVSGDRFIIV